MERSHDDASRSRIAASRANAAWRAVLLLALLVAAGASAQDAVQSATPAARRSFRVSYLSASAVYLDGGRDDGLANGARLEIRRGGDAIAMVEVSYVADHSASCRLVSQRQLPQQGDEALLLTAANEPAPGEAQPPTQPPVNLSPVPVTLGYQPPPPAALPWARVSGYFSLGTQRYSDQTFGTGWNDRAGRLSLRLRDIDQRPLEFRLRLSARQSSFSGTSGDINYPNTNRLYELSLAYTPVAARFSWAIGRLGASPFVSLGYLDGALGQIRLSRRFYVGAFAGSRVTVQELNLASAGTKYGGFFRYSTRPDEGPGYAEVVLAGIDEYAKGGVVSREYVSLESRFGSGARWSLFQRLELDLNRGWRKQVAGNSSQITNGALSASVRLSSRWRAGFTYDQNRNYLTFETRPLPEEVFTNFLRQGARASLEWQGPKGWNASTSVGQERDDSGGKPTDSAAISVYKANLFGWALLAGGDYSSYRGETANGYVTSLRVHKYFSRGDDLGLTFGASEARLGSISAAARKNRWVRLSGTLQLPLRLYFTGELEYDTGDDLHGRRYFVEMGYRF